jgi:hypothetical protein
VLDQSNSPCGRPSVLDQAGAKSRQLFFCAGSSMRRAPLLEAAATEM